MNNLLTLIKLNLINNLGLNKINKRFNKKGKIGLGALLLIVYILVLSLVTMYMFSFSTIFHMTNNDNYVFILGITISSMITFVSVLGQANYYIFRTKDYELLASMPIKSKTIVSSKIISLYVQNLIFVFTIMLGILITYTINVGFNVRYCIEYILYAFFTPMLPVALSSLIAYLFGFIPINRKIRNYIITFFYLVLVIGITFIYFLAFNSKSGTEAEQVQNIYNGMTKIYFLGRIGYHGMFDIKYYLLFIGINIGAFIFFIIVSSLGYNSLSNKNYEGKKNKKYNFEKENIKGSRSILNTLFKKEMKMYLNIPSYIVNTIVGPILSIMSVIIMSLNLNNISDVIISNFPNVNENDFIIVLIAIVLIFCFSITNTTSSSVSLEGKSFWVIKTAPVKTKDVLNSKILVNIVVFMPFLLIDLIIGFLFIKPTIIIFLFVLGILIIFLIGSIYYGLLCNLLLPRFDFDNPARAIKQSGAVLLNMGITFASSLVLIGIMATLLIIFGALVSMIVSIILVSIYAIIGVVLVNTVGVRKYNRL